eukprot:6194259-Pleurochrysis_carterae.AAC.3
MAAEAIRYQLRKLFRQEPGIEIVQIETCSTPCSICSTRCTQFGALKRLRKRRASGSAFKRRRGAFA